MLRPLLAVMAKYENLRHTSRLRARLRPTNARKSLHYGRVQREDERMNIVLLLLLLIFGGLVVVWLAWVVVFAITSGLVSAARDSDNSKRPNTPTVAGTPMVRTPAWIAAAVRLCSPDSTRR